MKILILTMIFLSAGAWLVQEQDTRIVHESHQPPSAPQKISPQKVTSDIPKRYTYRPQTIHHQFPEINSFEPLWDEEMHEILVAFDPIQGEEIFSTYVEERVRHEEKVNESLSASFNMLSDLNGQSGYSKQEMDVEVVDLEREHSARVKNILGDHYDYLDEQHQQFRAPSESEETGDLSR